MKDIRNRNLEIGDTIIYPSNGDLDLGQIIGFTDNAVKVSCYLRYVKFNQSYRKFNGEECKGYFVTKHRVYDINEHNAWKYIPLYKDVIIVDDYPKIDPNKLKSRKQLERVLNR